MLSLLNDIDGLRERVRALVEEVERLRRGELTAPTDLRAVVARRAIELAWNHARANDMVFAIDVRDTHGDGAWRVAAVTEAGWLTHTLMLDNRDWRYDVRVRAGWKNDADDERLWSEPSNDVNNLFVRRDGVVVAAHPDNAIVVQEAGAIESAIAQAGRENRPLVLQGMTIDRMLTFRNAARVTVRGCRFIGRPGGWFSGHSILIHGGLSESVIEDCTFTGAGDAAIAGGYGQSRGLVIRRCSFERLNQGIHLVGGGDESTVELAYLHFRQVQRMGIETQNGGRRTHVHHIVYEQPAVNPATGRVYGPDVFGVSVAQPEAAEAVVEDVWVIGPADTSQSDYASDRTRLGMAIELGARSAIARRCFIAGKWVCGFSFLSGANFPYRTQAAYSDCVITGVPAKPMGWGAPVHSNYGSVVRDGGGNRIVEQLDTTLMPPMPVVGAQ